MKTCFSRIQRFEKRSFSENPFHMQIICSEREYKTVLMKSFNYLHSFSCTKLNTLQSGWTKTILNLSFSLFKGPFECLRKMTLNFNNSSLQKESNYVFKKRVKFWLKQTFFRSLVITKSAKIGWAFEPKLPWHRLYHVPFLLHTFVS